MPENVVEQERRGDTTVVRLNRPGTKNSLTLGQMTQLGNAIQAVAKSGARCVLLVGAGGAFCAGRDLKETDPENDDTRGIMTSLINPLLLAVRSLPMPTVAAVHGPALGVGLGLALCCDIVLAAENAVLGSPFRNFGGVLDSGGHYFLERRVGRHRAAELIFTGRLITGREAAVMGLVNRALPAPELEPAALELCAQIASGPTAAFRATKSILGKDRAFEEVLGLEAKYMDAVLKGPDGKEGIKAFKEKRTPRFTGV